MSESVRIADVRIGRRYRRDMGDLSGLADSIKRVGLLHPIVVTEGDVLVAGERRPTRVCPACKREHAVGTTCQEVFAA